MLKVNSIQNTLDGGVSIKPTLSIAELRLTTEEHCLPNNIIRVLMNGSISEFYWDESSLLTDNNQTVIKPASISTGRWIKIYADVQQIFSESVMHIGFILDYSGSIADIPQFWQLCDGTNGTPDLRDKFIIGASNDNAGVPSTNVTGSLTKTGGTKDAIVVSHSHVVTDPGHRHLSNSTPGMGQGAAGASTVEQAAGQQNTTINTTGITIANAGTSGTNANLPPYYALAKIMFMGNPNNVSVPVTTLPLSDFVLKSDLTTVIPSGVIVDWSGSITNIPSNWFLCDGTNGTPDLRDKFIIGASNDNAGVPSTNVTGSLTKTGGTKDAIVVSHSHVVTDPGHAHNFPYAAFGSTGQNNGWLTQGPGGAFSGTSAAVTNISIASSGVSGTNANLPPYYALAKIMYYSPNPAPTGTTIPLADYALKSDITSSINSIGINNYALKTDLNNINSLKSMTAVNTTSGTFFDFIGFPTGVKRITIMFSGVSTNGTSLLRLQLGINSGVETTGYSGYSASVSGLNACNASSSGTSGFDYTTLNQIASNVSSGHAVFTNISGNTWVISSVISGNDRTNTLAGTKTLSGTLDRLRITTVNGTDLFDAGTINVMYE